MRWESLFDDLEASLAAQEQRELDAEVADRVRRERASLGLHERLAGARSGAPVSIALPGAGTGPVTVRGHVRDVGAGWVGLEDELGREVLVPHAAILWLTDLPRRHEQTSVVTRSFGLGAALRAVARDRATVTVRLIDGSELAGTLDAVGADTVELAEHPADVPRRPTHVSATRVLPLSAVALVRRT